MVFLMIFLFTTFAEANNLLVKPDGTVTACTQFNPCALQTAISQATDGDNIYGKRYLQWE